MQPADFRYSFTPTSHSFNNVTVSQTGDFLATPLYDISGLVRNSNNVGISGVTMTLSGGASRTTQTGGDGGYGFLRLPGGVSYTVTPSRIGFGLLPESQTVANLTNHSFLHFTAVAVDTISGVVSRVGGAGMSGVTVTLNGSMTATTATNINGVYFFGVGADGNYTVTPSWPGHIFNPPNRTFSSFSGNHTANFVGAQLHSISGSVRDAGNAPIGGVTMTLGGSQAAATQTDAAGNYVFANLPGGSSYTITPTKANYSFSPAGWSVATLGADETVNFVGTVFYSVSGRIADAAGVGVGGVTVTLNGSHAQTGQTDASGNYSLTGAPGGSYVVTPWSMGYSFAPVSQSFANLADNQTANFTATSSAGAGTLIPTADAYVQDGGSGDTNYGAAQTLEVNTDVAPDTGLNRDTYLRFDTGSASLIGSATLRLYGALSTSGTATCVVHAVADTTWSEGGITWNLKPDRGAALSSVAITSASAAWYDFDVTAYVLAERAAGRTVVSLALHNLNGAAGWLGFGSREAPSNAPQLVVTTATTTLNTAPTVNAGLDQIVGLSAVSHLRGTFTDDGLPSPPGSVTTTWSQVSGAGTVSFSNNGAAETTASFSVPDTYVLRLTCTDGELAVFDEVRMTVADDGGSPPTLDSDTGGVVNLRVHTPLSGIRPPP